MDEQYLPHPLAIVAVPNALSDKGCFAVQKSLCYFSLESEVHILRNIACEFCNARRVQLPCHDSNYMATRIQEWATAVARLNWRADLKIARVIPEPRESAHISNRQAAAYEAQPTAAFNADVGTELPPGVELHPVPNEVAARVPQTWGYRYVVANDRVLLMGTSRS